MLSLKLLCRLQIEGAHSADTVQTILTIDACTQGHFQHHKMLRDINKAMASFKAHRLAHSMSIGSGTLPTLSTGRWGCGAFGGKPSHKFIQQVLAAHLAGVKLEFSMYGTPDGCDTLWNALDETPTSGADVWRCLASCTSSNNFEADFIKMLKTPHESQQSSFDNFDAEFMV